MTAHTVNPVPSKEPIDLLFNAEKLDEVLNSTAPAFADRFGRLRKTWHGIEKQAQLDLDEAAAAAATAAAAEATAAAEGYRDEAELARDAAGQARDVAENARDDAVAAAGATGPLEFYDTYSDALAAAAGARRLVEVATDETREGSRTRYWAEAGALDFWVNLDQVRKDLADPTKGAALVALATVSIPNVSELLKVKQDASLCYLVSGYHIGSTVGGGPFRWIPAVPRSNHNGGTVLSPSVTWNGAEATFEAFVLAADTSGLLGCFVREGYNQIDVDFFGPFKRSTSDDSPALDAFAKALTATPMSAQILGNFYPSRSTYINAVINRNFFTDAGIFPKASVVQDVITFTDCWQMHHIGRLGITGAGGENFTARTARHGLVVTGANSGSTFDKINVDYMRGDGVVNAGINAMGGFNHIRAWNCGASPQGSVQKVSINFSAVVNAGSSGDPGQTSTLTISGFDTSKILPNAYLAYHGELYFIKSVTETSITVATFLPLGTTSGVVTLAQGAGLRNTGSDTSKVRVGTLDALVCGFGLQDLALYPATVQKLVTQYCGAVAIISSFNQASIGSVIVSGYFEANMLDWVKGTSSDSFSASVGLSVTLDPLKIKAIGARHATVPGYDYYTYLTGTALTLDVDGGQKVFSLASNPGIGQIIRLNFPTIQIGIADWKVLLFKHEVNTYTVYGTGGNLQPTGNVTLTVPAGFTINGAAGPLVISASTKPVKITVVRARNEYYPPGTDYIVKFENS